MLRRATAAALVVLVPLASGAFASAQAPTAAVQHQLKAAKKKAPPKPAAITLNGAGANSIDPFFESVFYTYHKANPKVTINYDPAGSSVGAAGVAGAVASIVRVRAGLALLALPAASTAWTVSE